MYGNHNLLRIIEGHRYFFFTVNQSCIQLKNNVHFVSTFVVLISPSLRACSPFCSAVCWVSTVVPLYPPSGSSSTPYWWALTLQLCVNPSATPSKTAGSSSPPMARRCAYRLRSNLLPSPVPE